jgi:hypothetical protein
LKEVKNKDKMMSNTKLDEKLEGPDNFRAWKYIISFVLEENDLSDYVMEEVAKPEEEEAKGKYMKNLIRAKRIIADSIKDHLIPHVSPLKTPKEMFDALSRLYEGRMWEDCVQEEARLGAREEKLSDDEEQALAAHFKKGKKNKGNHPP